MADPQTDAWPNPGPRWIPYPARYWRWRAIFNGWWDGRRRVGPEVDNSDPESEAPKSSALRAGSVEPLYEGDANAYEAPPFVSRFMHIAGWKADLLGQEFVEKHKRYERVRQLEAERIRECDQRIALAEELLEDLEKAGDPELVNVGQRRADAEHGVKLVMAPADDFEVAPLADLEHIFKGRAGDRAAANAAKENDKRIQIRQGDLNKAKADIELWRDNRHAASQEYVQHFADQVEWYAYMRTRYESLEAWIRMIVDVYWSSNRRVRRCLWRRIAQFLFGRWTRRPFVSDPVTISPNPETPQWIVSYSYLAVGPTSDPLARIGLATTDGQGSESR